jgi:uncharacterized protein YjiS (DUF1127 family)
LLDQQTKTARLCVLGITRRRYRASACAASQIFRAARAGLSVIRPGTSEKTKIRRRFLSRESGGLHGIESLDRSHDDDDRHDRMECPIRATETTFFHTDADAIVPKPIDVLVTWINRYLRYRQRQADLAILCGMTERELKDIGLCRGEIEAVTSRR